MKAQISLDFLRGILFAYIANQAWVSIRRIFLETTPFHSVQVIVEASLFLIYASLLLALLFRPFANAKLIFVSLLLLAILFVGSVSVGLTLVISRQPSFFSAVHQYPELFSISKHAVSLFLSIGSVVIAYTLYHKHKPTPVSS